MILYLKILTYCDEISDTLAALLKYLLLVKFWKIKYNL